MLWVLSIVIMLAFGLCAFFDAMTIMARTAASLEGRNAAGASLDRIMTTLKRFAMFIYPPILGFIILSGEATFFMFSVYGAFAVATLITLGCLLLRARMQAYFRRVTIRFVSGQDVSRALLASFWCKADSPPAQRQSKPVAALAANTRLYLFGMTVYFFYASAIFFLNMLSLIYAEFAVILLQMLGLINGVGTILLAFVVDPIISRKLDGAEDLDALSITVLLSQLTAYAVLAPVAFAFCHIWLL